MSRIETAEGTKFLCSCDGCRNWPRRVTEIWHESQINSKAEGYFFSPSTMKFFSSRIVTWKNLTNPEKQEAKHDGLAVVVSSRYGYEGAERDYEIVRLCQYGEITREANPSNEQGGEPFVKYATSKKARKALEGIGYPTLCPCHGCQLDRQGR